MFNIFAQMAFNLCLTVVIETAVAFLLKVRNIACKLHYQSYTQSLDECIGILCFIQKSDRFSRADRF